MGWFGKSKAEKEAEKQREERKAREDEEYEKLMEVMKRIERLKPVWTIERIEDAPHSRAGFNCSIFYQSPEGVCVRISSGSWYGERVPINVPCNCDVVIYKDKTANSPYIHIYTGTFFDRYAGRSGSVNPQAFNYLNNYLKAIVEPKFLQMKRAKEEQERRKQDAIDKFWNG